jgi:antirestriction protein ArdC
MMRVLKIGVGSQIGAGLSGYVAEMAGAFVCAALGIVPSVRHADYIGSWLKLWRGEHKANNREVAIM